MTTIENEAAVRQQPPAPGGQPPPPGGQPPGGQPPGGQPPGGQPPGGQPPMPPGVGKLYSTIFGALAAQTLGGALRLGIIDAIGDGAASADDVAARCDTDPLGALRLLRALTALQILGEDKPGVFHLEPAGQMVRTGQAGPLAALARYFTDPVTTGAWADLPEAVRTGAPTFTARFGQPYFDYLQAHPELGSGFSAAMEDATRAVADMVPHRYDFGRFGTVVDVGGGNGALLAGVLRQHPAVRGVLYDTATGIADAGDVLGAANVADRCTAMPGDFFESVPDGADLYVLKSVLHNWDDERATTILRNIRRAMPATGTLLIMEGFLTEAVELHNLGGYLIDLHMLVNFGGRERTADDFRRLCEGAGFAPPTIEPLPLPGNYSLIQTTPAGS